MAWLVNKWGIQTMLNMKLNIITSLAAIIALLCISLTVQTCRVNEALEENTILQADRDGALEYAIQQQDSMVVYKNKLGNQIARTKTIEVSLGNIIRLRNSERLSHLKQFEALKKKLTNLEQSVTIDAEINKDSIKVVTVHIPCQDSLKVFHYERKDEWNTISAMVVDIPKFEIKVPIRAVVYWQRKKKFLWWRVGKKEWYFESYSPNPLVSVTDQELIRVAKKK
jgi:hypothetical protein